MKLSPKAKKMLVLGGAAVAVVALARKIPTWGWIAGGALAVVALIPKLRRKLLPSS
jgi:hypothetical protein